MELGRRIKEFVDDEAKVESERLATLRGVFPEWEQSIWGPDATCARDARGKRIRPMRRLRNCNVTTVAPTGTISIIAGCSSGIEPLFAVAFMRNQAGVLMPDVNEEFVAIAKREGWYSEELMTRIAEAGHIAFPEVPARWQRVFVTANHIKPEWHIRMQAAFQEHNDSAISKTCNFANDATEAYVEEIYRLAFKLGCKGVTVYRDGSRDMQVLSTGSTAKKVAEAGHLFRQVGGPRRSGHVRHRRGRWVNPDLLGRPAWRDRRAPGRERAAAQDGARPRGREPPAPAEAVAARRRSVEWCAGSRRRSAPSTSPSPRTIAASRSKSS